MRRRAMIGLIGGGVVLAAGGSAGLLAFAGGGVPATATAPWRDAAGETELRRFVLAHALLAPNPHNMQPWLADLREPDSIGLRLDPSRLLPATEPFGRQILMGCGAFLELLALAAAARGQRAEIALFPEGEPGATLGAAAVARIRLAPDAVLAPDPLFAQVAARHTDRRAYDPARPPSEAESAALIAAAIVSPVVV